MDLKDKFLHVPNHKSFKKFLRFQWLESLYEWQVLPFGLKCSPKVLTKVLKPVMAFLRRTWGILIAIYMDDILIKGSFSPQMDYYAPGTTLLFLALDWCLIWERDISFSNLQATHFWL